MPGMTELDPASALLAVDSAAALVAAAQMNVVEFHTWNSTVRHIDEPDRIVFDLDPGEGTPWSKMQEAAWLVKGFLEELGLQSWLKTSGGKGLHVVVPLKPKLGYEQVKDLSQKVVLHLARVVPSRFVAKSGPANRVGKIFVDYLRNGHGQTTAAAYSARARPGLGVSIPVAWDELNGLKSGSQWTIANARDRISFLTGDPLGRLLAMQADSHQSPQDACFRPVTSTAQPFSADARTFAEPAAVVLAADCRPAADLLAIPKAI